LQEAGRWRAPIVTQVLPAPTFFVAEEQHQRYFSRNPNAGYCRSVVAPKVAKARKEFFDRFAR